VLQTRSISGSDLVLKAFIFINSPDCYVQVDSGDKTTIIFPRLGMRVDKFFATNVEPDKKMLLEGNSKLDFFLWIMYVSWLTQKKRKSKFNKETAAHNS
jgi:hypothetical protein